MYLTNLSLKRSVFATVTILALVVLGFLSYFGLNINDYPEVEFPYVAVTIIQQGASPEQIESKIALKVEEAIGQISGIKHIYSIVNEGVSMTWAEFTLETPSAVAAQDVRDKLSTIRGDLPQDIEEPVIARFDPMAVPIMSLAVTGDISLREITAIVEDQVKRPLEAVKGVGAVNMYGDEEREIQIQLDKEKMALYGLTTVEILDSLRSENLDIPGGKLSDEGREITLRTAGNMVRVEDFANLPVARRSGVQLYVKDVARVVDGTKEKSSLALYQGKQTIGLDIIKQSGTNTVKVADTVRKTVEELQKGLPHGVKVNIVTDNSSFIRESVQDVFRTIIEGSILAVLTVFVFLRNWRSTAISAVSIPTSIITTFFMMRALNFSLNYLSLMALSLSVGLLIDDAIVVIENITRHMSQGKSALTAAKEATTEIGLAVTATSLTIVAVFLPVAGMTGIIGQFFKQFGLTVVCAVLMSLLVSFTLVPLMSSRVLKQEEPRIRGPVGVFLGWFNKGLNFITGCYAQLLKGVLRHRWLTLGLATVLFVGSLMMVGFLGSSFIPSADIGQLNVSAQLDSGLSLEAAENITVEMEKAVRSLPEVVSTYSKVKADNVNMFVELVDKKERQRSVGDIARDLREKFKSFAGIQVAINTNSGIDSAKTVEWYLLGQDDTLLQGYAEKALQVAASIPGAVDVASSYKPGKAESKIEIKHDLAADLGISTGQVADTLYTLFSGTVVGQFEEGEDRFDVRVRLQDANRKNIDDLSNIYLPSRYAGANGENPMIPLDQVTEKVFNTSSSEILRYDRTKEILISANLDGISLGEFNKLFNEKFAQEVHMPAGYRIFAGGESELMGDTFSSMGMAIFTAVLFIFFILAAQFESYIDPFAIMLSLPLAIIGAVLGLWVMGSDLSLMSMIGIIMLMGLVTKNAILLVDFAKQQRAKGVERSEALLKAAVTRLRPIMMTTVAMIFGMMPLALALGKGAESRAPMAHAIIGGLITSTLLTLVVVPVIYTILDDLKNWGRKHLRKKSPARQNAVKEL
ncbi:efflux RND transporter permease subunit [Candidatus Formimonas warabiya]|uniref:Acriflavin resistance protein n=1 Tax=Formimonas warabiya TaxID=1761012 RepID=A0A3G1L0M8_FORW1|nr:efflux RND transporter permease subunit [Candidatus Formimonas warabiya]ATW28208.1 acriflavin resistance protein [Candidatus Formimonas warabiya]